MNEKKCRSLGIASIVCAGVSLVIFRALLDIVGFVLGMLAFRGAKGLLAANPADPYAQNAFKLARIGVVLSLVAFIANMLTAVFLMPQLMQGSMGISGATF